MVLQVGTAVVTRGKDQRLALGRLGALVEQLEALVRSGRQMILVSSGSVSVGRQKLRQSQILNSSPLEMQISGPGTVCSECHALSSLGLCKAELTLRCALQSAVCTFTTHFMCNGHLPAHGPFTLSCTCQSSWHYLYACIPGPFLH